MEKDAVMTMKKDMRIMMIIENYQQKEMTTIRKRKRMTMMNDKDSVEDNSRHSLPNCTDDYMM